MFSQAVLLSLVLFSSASALALTAPAATHTPQPYGVFPQHSNPKPTEAPFPHELLRRQSTQRTLLAAPDQTCGYFGGASDRPWGCSTGNCVFATPTPIANSIQFAAGSVLCCDPSTGCPSSPAPTACVDNYNNAVSTSSSCSGSCSADPMTLTCTSGIYIFCNTLTFATPSISALFCNYISNPSTQNATTTYDGQTSHSLTPTVPIFAESFTPTTSSTIRTTSFSSSKTTTSPTATAVPSTGGKRVDKRAIIGGVIGGVVGLALLIGAVIMFLRWRNGGDEGKGEGNTESLHSEEVVVKPSN